MWNSQIYYQNIRGVQMTFRFASFCWKLGESPKSYKNLSFTINSIYNPNAANNSLLLMNGYPVRILYAFQDASQPSVFNESTFNSCWINANSNDNPVYSGTFHLQSNKYGVLGGSISPGVTIPNGSNNATINAFIPTINPVSNSVYLYLRIVVPMDVDIRFGNVSAMVSTL
jgi:hypothetical protein